jgi:hypothetical protein
VALVEVLAALGAADGAELEDPVGLGEEVEGVLEHGLALIGEGVEPP